MLSGRSGEATRCAPHTDMNAQPRVFYKVALCKGAKELVWVFCKRHTHVIHPQSRTSTPGVLVPSVWVARTWVLQSGGLPSAAGPLPLCFNRLGLGQTNRGDVLLHIVNKKHWKFYLGPTWARQNQGVCAGPHGDRDGYGPKTSFKSHHGGLKQIGFCPLLPWQT